MSGFWFRVLRRLYPKRFRERYSRELDELYLYRAEQARSRGGWFWRTRFLAYITTDTVATAWVERRRWDNRVQEIRRTRGSGMDGWIQDLRYSVRRLVRAPGFTLSAIAILAIGIGVNSAAFSFVNAVLLQQPPFEDPDGLVEVLQGSDGGGPSSTSYPAYLDIAEHSAVFSSVGARAGGRATLEQDGVLSELSLEYATSSYLPTLGLSVTRGRWFDPSEDLIGGAPVAVMSHAMWRNRFGADPEVIGTQLRLSGGVVTVVGVGPEEYNGGMGVVAGDLWLSISAMPVTGGPARSLERRMDHPMRVAARLAPGVTRDAATEAMNRLAARLEAEYPDINRNRGMYVLPMLAIGAENRGEALPIAALLMTIVVLVLIVVSVNLANLLLVRGVSRAREVGVRLALGGSRARVVRVLLGEVLILASVGGAAGLGLSWFAFRSLSRVQLTFGGPMTVDLRMDASVLLFTASVALLASLVAGVVPALRSTASGVLVLLQERVERRRGRVSLQGLLVGAQVAVSVVLLVTAGLFVERLLAANSSDPGFEVEGLAMVGLSLAPMQPANEEVRPTFARLEERLEGLPEVESATLAINTPLGYRGTTTLLVGDLVDGRRRPVEVPWNIVGPDYLETVGIELLHGRFFNDSDRPEDPTRAVVSEAMARAFWGRTDVVGENYTSENAPEDPVEIIGVVGDVALQSVLEQPRPAVYWSTTQMVGARMRFIVRSAGDATRLLNPIRRVVRETDPRIAVLDVATMEMFMGERLTQQRMTSWMLLMIGVFALGVASLGIYAVVSFGVSRRLGEIGVRIALGAARGSVVGLFLREAGGVVLGGTAVGLALSWPIGQLVTSQFTGTAGVPPGVPLVAVATLAGAAMVATFLPARRAAHLDPARTLREE